MDISNKDSGVIHCQSMLHALLLLLHFYYGNERRMVIAVISHQKAEQPEGYGIAKTPKGNAKNVKKKQQQERGSARFYLCSLRYISR